MTLTCGKDCVSREMEVCVGDLIYKINQPGQVFCALCHKIIWLGSKASVMILSRICWRGWVGQTSLSDCGSKPLNQSPMLPLKRTAWVTLSWRFLMTQIHGKAACQILSKAFLIVGSLWRHGRGPAAAGDISYRECLGWSSALLCFFLLWSLPVLQWSSLLAALICSVWSSAWFCLSGCWNWSFSSSGTAAGCLSWEVWWPRTGSKGLAIFLSARSCCRLLWEQWLFLLHMLGVGLLRLGCCQLQLTSLSIVVVLQLPLLCEWWGGHPLSSSSSIP